MEIGSIVYISKYFPLMVLMVFRPLKDREGRDTRMSGGIFEEEDIY